MEHGKDQTKVNASSCKENVKDKDPCCKGSIKEKTPCTEQQKVRAPGSEHQKN